MNVKFQVCRKYFNIILFFIFVQGPVLFAQSEEQAIKKADELIAAGKFREAVESLTEKAAAGENSGALHLKLGLAYKGLYQFDFAKTELEEALRLSPDSPEILYSLGSCYKSLDRPDDAESAFQKSFILNPGNVNAAVDLCTIFMMQNKYDSAAVVYNKLLENDTTNSYFYKQLGSCYVKIDSVSDAIHNYEKSLNYNPKDAGTFARLAQIFYKQGMLDTAAVIIERGLLVQRMNPDLNKLAAEIYFKNNNYFGAIKHYLNVVITGDSTAPVYQKLGLSYYLAATSGSYPNEQEKNRKLEEGINALNKAFEKDSTQALTQFYLGITYKELSQYEKAIEHLNTAVKLVFPDYLDDIYTHLGISYELNNNYILAIENFQKALKENPLRSNIIYYLAALYDKFYSDKSVALTYYRKFLKEAESPDEKLKSYAEERIEKLKEEIHFSK